jgi:starch-binding outer membrane protein, SusD/RagB family
MRKYSILFALSAVFAGSYMSGCRKPLDIDPQQSIEASTALTTKEGINAALLGIYSREKSLRLYGRDNIAIPEALADNGWATNKSGRLLPESNNTNRAHFLGDTWQLSYKSINEANLILVAVQTNQFLTAAEKSSIEGQALFLRALNHFNVVLPFAYVPGAVVAGQDKGGVPIMLTPVNTIDGALVNMPARAPIADVYAQIVKDFEDANAKLTVSGVSPFNNGANGPNFANKSAAQVLLSRVNLYRKNYAEAKRWADSAITSAGSKFTTGGSYVSGWKASSHPETLFQIAFSTAPEGGNPNESLQTTFTTLGASLDSVGLPVGFGDVVPSLYLLDDLGIALTGGNTATNFKTGPGTITSRSADVRNQLYRQGNNGRGKVFVECIKYLGKNGVNYLDHTPVVRISEAYLNRAEAMATTGSSVYNAAAALADLNTILTGRGLAASSATGTALFDEIFKQRRIEFAFEGHRFWDLKRLGRDLIKAPLWTNDVPFIDYRILAPIPTRELTANPNLVQNTGY